MKATANASTANPEAGKFKDLKNITEVTQSKHTNNKSCISTFRALRSGVGMLFPPVSACWGKSAEQHFLEAYTASGPAPLEHAQLLPQPSSLRPWDRVVLSARGGPRGWHVGSPWRVHHLCVGTSADSLHPCCLLVYPTAVAQVRGATRTA